MRQSRTMENTTFATSESSFARGGRLQDGGQIHILQEVDLGPVAGPRHLTAYTPSLTTRIKVKPPDLQLLTTKTKEFLHKDHLLTPWTPHLTCPCIIVTVTVQQQWPFPGWQSYSSLAITLWMFLLLLLHLALLLLLFECEFFFYTHSTRLYPSMKFVIPD